MSIKSLKPSTAVSKSCLPEGKGTGVAGVGVTKDTELVTFHKGNSRAPLDDFAWHPNNSQIKDKCQYYRKCLRLQKS